MSPPDMTPLILLAGDPASGGWSLGTRVVVYLAVLLPACGAAAVLGAALAAGSTTRGGARGIGGGGRVVARLAGYLAVLALCFTAAHALGSATSPGWLR